MFERKRFQNDESQSMVSSCVLPSCAPRKREFIGAAIGGATSVLGGIFGSSKMSEALDSYKQAHNENSAYYKRLMSENYLDTSAGQETVRQARETMKSGTDQAAGAAAFGGATDSSAAAARESANKQVGNMMGGIAANDVQRKDNAGNALAQENNSYAENVAKIKMGQAQAITTAAQGVANAASSLPF